MIFARLEAGKGASSRAKRVPRVFDLWGKNHLVLKAIESLEGHKTPEAVQRGLWEPIKWDVYSLYVHIRDMT